MSGKISRHIRGVKGHMRSQESGQRYNDRGGRSKVTLGVRREVIGHIRGVKGHMWSQEFVKDIVTEEGGQRSH